MILRILVLWGLALAALGGERPNIVVIIADDQGWGDLGVHGNKTIRTPHLDGLAGSGARFDRFYVAPVCAPTRASLLTGRYHRRTGVRGVTRSAERMNLDEVTMADVFKAQGYRTGAFGKWHNGSVYPYHPNGRGFDEFYGFCCGHWGHYFDPRLEHNGRPVQGKGFIADVFTERAIAYIGDQAKKDEPFLCWLAYCTPHSPFQVADADWDRIAGREIVMRNRDPEKEDPVVTRAALALVENIDRNVGRLLGKLDELKIRDNTIVIYLSDNGPNSWRWNDGMKGKKGSVDEGGVRVPFFVSWPGRIEASVIGTPAAHIDLLPTLCDLCDVPLPKKNPLDGRSLKPLLQQEDVTWTARNLFSNWGKRVSVRAGDMRADRRGLYDLKMDPGQARNLAGGRKELHASLVKEMDVFLEATQPTTGPGAHHVGFPEFPLVTLNAQEAKFAGKGLKYSSIHPNASWIRNWTDPQDWPFWEIEVVEKGTFEVSLLYTCEEDAVGTRLEAAVGDQSARGEIVKAFNPPHFEHHDRAKRGESFDKPFETMKLGVLQLDKGTGILTLKALSKPGREVMHLRAIRLERQ